MKKINLLFPLMFIFAFSASSFSNNNAAKKKKGVGFGFYRDAYGYCSGVEVDDSNCSPDLMGPVCQEFVLDGGPGWTTIFENAVYSTCYQPLYSLYPNNP